jgi:glyoxylase-like metal-dependent hydrolase (beta-lactamase superfamily II)
MNASSHSISQAKFFLAGTEELVADAEKYALTAKLEVQSLRGNVSVVSGAGGNITVLPGPDGLLLIDSGFAGAQPQVGKALAGISPDPIKHLINTHWHFDHTHGNEWVHAAGAAILAHRNTLKHLSVDTRVDGWNFTFPAVPAGGLPTEIFDDAHTVHLNGATLELKHYAPAHTDSDISINFTDVDIFHAADTFWNGAYPFVDYCTGGSIDGAIRAAELNLTRVTDKTIVIPGHGPVGNKSQMVLFRDVLVEIREKVAALKKQGRTLAQIIASKPGAKYDATWGNLFMNPAMFTTLVYQGV